MRTILAFIRLGRLHFLIGGLVFHALGAAIALYQGAVFDLTAFVWGQIAITATQLATHYSNDYFDLEADRANRTPTRWSGGSRVLPDNLIPPRWALRAAISLSLIAFFAGIQSAAHTPDAPLILPLLLTALGLSWAYSAPPFKLHSRGVGEVSTAILVPGMTTLVGFYLQSHKLDLLPFLSAFPLGCLQFAMLLLIEFPDAEGDRAVGKNTLVVRLGGKRAARLHNLAVGAAYLSLPVLVALGLPRIVMGMALLIAPIAAWHGWRIARGAWGQAEKWNSLGFMGVFFLIGTAILEVVGFVLLIGMG